MAKTWVLTGSLDNFRATREHGFRVIGAKERRRGLAEQIAPGDRIVLYVTGVQAFGAIICVTGQMYEDRAKIWPGKPGKVDAYPWRFETEPELVLDEHDFVPAAELVGELEHARKWPAEHWQLAFQGQLRTVSDADDRLLERRMREAAPRGGVSAGGQHERHYTPAEASALLPRVGELLSSMRRARERLGDAEARAALVAAGPGNGGGGAGKVVSEGFLELRESMLELRDLGVVLRDLDRGLVDFPALRDGREVYLCWEEGEPEIGFWHEPQDGFGGRRPLEDG